MSSPTSRIKTRLIKWRRTRQTRHLSLFAMAVGAFSWPGHLPRINPRLKQWHFSQKPWHSALFGAAIGALSWSGHLWALPAVFLLPFALSLPGTQIRLNAIALMFGYFAGAMWPMIPGAALFLGTKNFPTEAILLWIAYAALQTVPYFLIVWRPKGWAIGFALATLLSVFSPIAILNPLTVAGACFPGWGVFGVLAVAILFATIPMSPRTSFSLLAAASLAATLLYKPPPQPNAWIGNDTEYGGTSFAQQGTAEYTKAAAVRDSMFTTHDAVRLYPESTLVHWNAATNGFFRPLSKKLEAHHQTVILGADITHRGGVGYDNALIIFGADKGIYLQHLPMPYSMWNPHEPDSVPLRAGGPYTLMIHQLRAAPVICYEQLHPFPFLRASLDHPQIILAVANDYWAKTTYIRYVQHTAVAAWARLFNLPFLSATNQ